MVSKAKKEIEVQFQQVEAAWKKYLPAELVREGRESIARYTQLLKEEYSKVKGLN